MLIFGENFCLSLKLHIFFSALCFGLLLKKNGYYLGMIPNHTPTYGRLKKPSLVCLLSIISCQVDERLSPWVVQALDGYPYVAK